ncbi:MAG: hypothetical protein Q8900_03205 [Bacillota bacterium]|nr:hypothetical protein [Bacillota bacterium]
MHKNKVGKTVSERLIKQLLKILKIKLEQQQFLKARIAAVSVSKTEEININSLKLKKYYG